jgi:hypothetical protein
MWRPCGLTMLVKSDEMVAEEQRLPTAIFLCTQERLTQIKEEWGF